MDALPANETHVVTLTADEAAALRVYLQDLDSEQCAERGMTDSQIELLLDILWQLDTERT